MVSLLRRLVCLFLLLPLAMRAQSVALTGTVLTPQGVLEHGTVLVQDGRIVSVGAAGTLPKGTSVVEVDGIIAPGFIDLHNHMSYNVFPRWKTIEEFGARYDWQQKPVYQLLIEAPHRELVEQGFECDMERYAEMKAIAQGETSVVGSAHGCSGLGLDRELDRDPRLGSGAARVVYNVFPFQMKSNELTDAKAALDATPRGALLIHVSEGGPHDASAAREFRMFVEQGFLRPGVSVIHGVAIKPEGFAMMAKAGVGFVWSPRSNIELYGDTADAAAAKAAGVTMALAPDWSPTGSTGTLNELNYAREWDGTQSPMPFTDRELVAMTAENPAKLVDLDGQIGAIALGHAADLVVLHKTRTDAYASLTHAAPQDVELVMIGGQPMYGDPALLTKLAATPKDTVEVCGATKAFTAAVPFAATVTKLTPAMEETGRELAPLTECGQ